MGRSEKSRRPSTPGRDDSGTNVPHGVHENRYLSPYIPKIHISAAGCTQLDGLNGEGGGGSLKTRCGHRVSLLVPMLTRSSRLPIAPNGCAGLAARPLVDKGGHGLVLTRFFTAGSPFSAIRGARLRFPLSTRNSIQTTLGLWLHYRRIQFFPHAPSENPLMAQIFLCVQGASSDLHRGSY